MYRYSVIFKPLNADIVTGHWGWIANTIAMFVYVMIVKCVLYDFYHHETFLLNIVLINIYFSHEFLTSAIFPKFTVFK